MNTSTSSSPMDARSAITQLEARFTSTASTGGYEYRLRDNRQARPRKIMQGSPTIRTLIQAARNPRLSGFSTGTSTKHEEDVNNLVACYYSGAEISSLAVMETATGDVAGVCGYTVRALELSIAVELPKPAYVQLPVVNVPNAVYITVIGVAARYRGYRLEDGTRLGTYLLGGGIREIRRAWGDSGAPAIWAYVHPENENSHKMFTAHGFARTPARQPGADEKRYRPREK